MSRAFKYTILIILACFCRTYAQFTPAHTQYMFHPSFVNPASTGSDDAVSLALAYRNQWTGMTGAPKTCSFALQSPLKNEKIAAGLLLYNDVAGLKHNNGIFVNYAYRFRVRNGKFSLGLAAGTELIKQLLSQAVVIDPEDEIYMSDKPLTAFPNFSAGIYYYTKSLFAGISAPCVLTPAPDRNGMKVVNDFANYNYFLSAGYRFTTSGNLILIPSVLIKYHSAGAGQAEFNLAAMYRDFIGFGVSYRIKESLAFMLKLQVNRQSVLGYSYDYSLSDLKRNSNGTHEIYLKYIFRYYAETVNPKFF